MPGWELVGSEEKEEINKIFDESNGVMFAHGFDKLRNGHFRVRDFERNLCDVIGAPHCLATTSGTMAQYLAMKALGIGPGDEVITQAFTFVATVEVIVELGATPVIVDVDDSYNMSPAKLREAITERTKLIIPVHMLGNPCDMDQINQIARSNDVPVLEDACEAFGAKYKGQYIGTLSDMSVVSFDFAKTITTGEGGALFCKSPDFDSKARQIHDHGHENNPLLPRGLDTRSIPGLNLRMTEMQAAFGIAQLKKLSKILEVNRKAKSILKSQIKPSEKIQFRRLNDDEELADTLIFALPTKSDAENIARSLSSEGFGTKNLPDAFCWHFSGTWNHMFWNVPKYRHSWMIEWSYTRRLLERSISLPILCAQPAAYYEKQAEIISKLVSSI